MKGKHRHPALLACSTVVILMLVPVCLTAFAVYRQQRQERLDHALIAAVKANDANAAIALLKQGADPNAHDKVHPAAPFWQRIVAVIRGSKSKPSTAPTPLMLAVMWKDRPLPNGNLAFPPENVALTGALLEHGADVNFHDERQITPLFFAIMGEKEATMHLFLAHGANVNQRDSTGSTALFTAVMVENAAVVKQLLAHHADVTIRGWRGSTPLALAKEFPQDNQEIIHLLKAAGAKQ